MLFGVDGAPAVGRKKYDTFYTDDIIPKTCEQHNRGMKGGAEAKSESSMAR